MTAAPSVSIVIPTWNRPTLLQRSVASALAACPLEHGEVLVIDDHSSPPATTALSGIQDPRLRILRNDGSKGAAGVRNFGIAAAKGEVIFLLDDDDELLPGYPGAVLATALPQGMVFGISQVAHRRGDEPVLWPDHQGSGPVPQSAPFRKRLAPTSAGFWIIRHAFLEIGGFHADQTVDEDTDLCCRLASAKAPMWFHGEAGVIVSAGRSGPETRQLSHDTKAGLAARCYLRTYRANWAALKDYRGARWYLLARFLRRAAKAGEQQLARQVLAEQKPFGFALAGHVFLTIKLLSARFRPGRPM